MGTLKTMRGEQETSIKRYDTYTPIELLIEGLAECLIPGTEEVEFYLSTGDRNAKTFRVSGKIVRPDTGAVQMVMTKEGYDDMEPGMYSVECHVTFGDGRYGIFPSSTPFYLTIGESLKVAED